MSERIAYRVHEAADLIGISRAKLYQLVAAGDLATFKIGAATLIRADELRAFIDRLSHRRAA
jgi:excisionase family DNA binding protein